MTPHTVVVCDTQPVAVEGLCRILQNTAEYRVVAAGNSLVDGMGLVRSLRPTLWALDKSFGVREILECLDRLQDFEERPAVVVWGDPLSQAEALRLLKAGAGGVVRKTAGVREILACFQSVAGGETWTEEGFRLGPNRVVCVCQTPLTPREAEIMGRLELGWRNRDIAAELGIRVGTVKIHVKHIFEKTGIRGRYGLAISSLRERAPLPEVHAV